MLVEFWDFCRPNSMRTLPYVKAWHERYARAGLRVFGVHCPGFDASRGEQEVRDAVARLGIDYPVLIDSELDVWMDYGNEGWPARYLFDGRARLFELHYGEGALHGDRACDPGAPRRSSASRSRHCVRRTRPARCWWHLRRTRTAPTAGPYEAGGVWAVLDGAGVVKVNGGGAAGATELSVAHPGAYALLEHDRHTVGVLELEIGSGVSCLATCFTAGLA